VHVACFGDEASGFGHHRVVITHGALLYLAR
jgi:hypothetical protein